MAGLESSGGTPLRGDSLPQLRQSASAASTYCHELTAIQGWGALASVGLGTIGDVAFWELRFWSKSLGSDAPARCMPPRCVRERRECSLYSSAQIEGGHTCMSGDVQVSRVVCMLSVEWKGETGHRSSCCRLLWAAQRPAGRHPWVLPRHADESRTYMGERVEAWW